MEREMRDIDGISDVMRIEENGTTVRWGAWFEDRNLPLDFPRDWRVQTFKPQGGRSLTEGELRAALDRAIGSRPLDEIVENRQDAVIVIDDVTRPTPAHRLLPLLIQRLTAGGIERENIRILIGLGAHPPPPSKAIIRKVGKAVGSIWLSTGPGPQ